MMHAAGIVQSSMHGQATWQAGSHTQLHSAALEGPWMSINCCSTPTGLPLWKTSAPPHRYNPASCNVHCVTILKRAPMSQSLCKPSDALLYKVEIDIHGRLYLNCFTLASRWLSSL